MFGRRSLGAREIKSSELPRRPPPITSRPGGGGGDQGPPEFDLWKPSTSTLSQPESVQTGCSRWQRRRSISRGIAFLPIQAHLRSNTAGRDHPGQRQIIDGQLRDVTIARAWGGYLHSGSQSLPGSSRPPHRMLRDPLCKVCCWRKAASSELDGMSRTCRADDAQQRRTDQRHANALVRVPKSLHIMLHKILPTKIVTH